MRKLITIFCAVLFSTMLFAQSGRPLQSIYSNDTKTIFSGNDDVKNETFLTKATDVWTVPMTFAQVSGTYTEITGGTVLGTIANDDQVFNNSTTGASPPVTNTGFPIGFNFSYNGIVYDKFAVNNNGWILLGTGSFAIAGTYTPLSVAGPAGYVSAISPFGRDLQGQTGSELSYLLQGTSPNQILTIQWKGYRRYSSTGENFNFQIKLYETTNVIEFVYGPYTCGTTAYTCQVGIRGATNADFNNRTTTTNWAATTAGTVNTGTCSFSSTVYPASGLTFQFVPPVPLDAGITGFTSPISGLAGTYDIITTLKNFGSTALTACDINYSINGTPATYNWTGNLALGASENVTLVTGHTFAAGSCSLTATAALAGDQNTSNDGFTQNFSFYDPFIPEYIQGFNDGAIPQYWLAQTQLGAVNWDYQTTGTNPTCTPHSAPGMMRYNSFSSSSGNSALLYSPAIDLSTGRALVNFWMYRDNGYNTTADRVEVYVNTTNSITGALLLGTVNRAIGLAPVVAANGWYEYTFVIPDTYNTNINYVILRAVSGYGNNMFIDDFSVIEPLMDDASVTAILTPGTDCGLTNSEFVQVIVKNNGLNPISSLPIQYTVNGGAAVLETIAITPDPIQIFETDTLTFAVPCDLSAIGDFTIEVTALLPGDEDASNDAFTKFIRNSWDFSEAYTMGFENSEFEERNLYTHSNSTWGTNNWGIWTGAPHTGTFMMGTDFGPGAVDDWLFTRCFYLEAGVNYGISFWYNGFAGLVADNHDLVLAYGDANTPAAMTNVIVDLQDIATASTYIEEFNVISVATSGIYYFGWHVTGPDAAAASYLMIDDINISVVLNNDAGIVEFVNLPYGISATAGVNIDVVLKNFGTTDLTAVDIDYTIDYNGNVFSDTYSWAGTLATNETEIVTIGTYDFIETGEYNLTAQTTLSNDEDPTNDLAEGYTYVYEIGDVLFDNGPIVTNPGAATNGADLSVLENTTLGFSSIGYGHAVSAGQRVCDEFIVPEGEEWSLNGFASWAYQTGSTLTSTINNLNLRIWDAAPNAGGNIIFDLSTYNLLVATEWDSAYRVTETTLTDVSRPLMKDTAFIPEITFGAGTYWIDWQTGGSLGSGPWIPAVTILGQGNTGNAVQYASGVWNNLLNNAYPQGMPFQIFGSITTAPEPLVLFPEDAATNVGLNTVISVTFDQPVNLASSDVTIQDDMGNPVNITSITIDPSDEYTVLVGHDIFDYSTTYTVSFADGAVATEHGTLFSSAFNWSFTTGATNTEANFLTYEFPGISTNTIIDNEDATVIVTVPQGTDMTALVADFTVSYGATVYDFYTNDEVISGVTEYDYSVFPAEFNILAEDGVTEKYWYVVVIEEGVTYESELIAYDIPNQISSTIEGTNVTILMPQGTDLTSLVADYEVSYGAILFDPNNEVLQISGETENNFINPLVLWVYAHDISEYTEYTITVNIYDNIYEKNDLVKIYPNPTNGLFTINVENESNIRITDIMGKEILDEKIYSTVRYDFSNQPAGVYTIQVITNNVIREYKLVIE